MKQRGFGLLEIVIAVSLISGTIFSLAFVFLLANKLEVRASNQVRANFLAEEGLEVLRSLRDKSWSDNLASLNAGTTYYLSFNPVSSSWSVTTSNPGLIDGVYARSFAVASVNRDDSDNIVSSGGTLDPNTKEFRVSVSWQERGVYSTTTVSTYLSDIFQN
ncbi:MAG: hypothetical protein HYW15_01010 [Candidatus Giovannonibacteria bacterium]|nr:MAG: hypothetical protein HYW15_01010 [Candidatus Giovannonibacteria bacterium]